MNAAFLLVTTAWLAGADVAADPRPIVIVPTAASAPVASGCGGCATGGCGSAGCGDTCCEEEKPSLLERLKARLHKGHGDSCDSCGTEAKGCGGSTEAKGCGGCAEAKPEHKFRLHKAESCDSCEGGGGEKEGLMSRFKGLFKHHKEADCGCDSGCAGGGCAGGGCAGGGCAGGAPVTGTITPAPIGGTITPAPVIGTIVPGTGNTGGKIEVIPGPSKEEVGKKLPEGTKEKDKGDKDKGDKDKGDKDKGDKDKSDKDKGDKDAKIIPPVGPGALEVTPAKPDSPF